MRYVHFPLVWYSLLLDSFLTLFDLNSFNVGTALVPSALLVAGVYAVKPEFVAYAAAAAAAFTGLAFFAGGSSK